MWQFKYMTAVVLPIAETSDPIDAERMNWARNTLIPNLNFKLHFEFKF